MKLLQTQFVPVAIDQAYQRRQKDTEGEFYRKIARQSPRSDFKSTTQGLFLVSPDGTLLGYTNHRAPERLLTDLEKWMQDYKPSTAEAIVRKKTDERYSPSPPKDGLIVRTRTKVLDGYKETSDNVRRIFQSAVSRDNLWITAEEHRSLVKGRVVPQTLQNRIARFHLVDATRGEPSMWRSEEIQEISMRLAGTKLTGNVVLATTDGKRRYIANILGTIESTEGKVTRFDFVALGNFVGEGRYTRGAPKGEFPLAVSFELADGSETADRIPPQGSRGWLPGYLEE